MYETVVAFLRPYTLLWLVLLVAVINLWRKRRETRRRLLLVTIPFVALQLISTPLVAHLVLAGGVFSPDEVRDRAELADDTRLRCLYAAELYRQGPACPILVSGGKVD